MYMYWESIVRYATVLLMCMTVFRYSSCIHGSYSSCEQARSVSWPDDIKDDMNPGLNLVRFS